MDYPYIRVWGKQLGSYPYYIEMQVKKAKAENAPERAVFKEDNGQWCTIDDCCKETFYQIDAEVKYMLKMEALKNKEDKNVTNREHIPQVD